MTEVPPKFIHSYKCPICFTRFKVEELLTEPIMGEKLCPYCAEHPWYAYPHYSHRLAARMIEVLDTMDQSDMREALQFILSQCVLKDPNND